MRSEWHNLEALCLGLVAIGLVALYMWSELSKLFWANKRRSETSKCVLKKRTPEDCRRSWQTLAELLESPKSN
jgi:hypothetical protein